MFWCKFSFVEVTYEVWAAITVKRDNDLCCSVHAASLLLGEFSGDVAPVFPPGHIFFAPPDWLCGFKAKIFLGWHNLLWSFILLFFWFFPLCNSLLLAFLWGFRRRCWLLGCWSGACLCRVLLAILGTTSLACVFTLGKDIRAKDGGFFGWLW